MKLRAVQYITIFLLVLVAGVFWGTWFSLSRSISSLAPETFLMIGKVMIHNLAMPMSILMLVAIFSTIVLLFLLPEKKSKIYYAVLLGFLLLIITTFVTVFIEVSIVNQITKWTVAILPQNWEQLRDQWEFYHTLRTFTALASFAFIFLGAFQQERR